MEHRESQKKWGTLLSASLIEQIEAAARREGVTISQFAARSLSARVHPSLLSRFPPDTRVVASHEGDRAYAGDLGALLVLADRWAGESLRVLPGSPAVVGRNREVGPELRRSVVSLCSPKRNRFTQYLQEGFAPEDLTIAECHCFSDSDAEYYPRQWHVVQGNREVFRHAIPLVGSGGAVYETWGLIRHSANPWGIDSAARCLLLAGVDQSATFACALAATSGRFFASLCAGLGIRPGDALPSFECLVAVRMLQQGEPVPLEPFPGTLRRLE